MTRPLPFLSPESVYRPCSMMKPTTPSRLTSSRSRSRKDTAAVRLPRMSSITSARVPNTAASRSSAAAARCPAARIFQPENGGVLEEQQEDEEDEVQGREEGPGQRGGGRWGRVEEEVQEQDQGEGVSGAIPSVEDLTPDHRVAVKVHFCGLKARCL